MSRPIQALSPTFLKLLGLQNMGALPADMVDAVQPVIDMEMFYLQGTAQNRRDTVVDSNVPLNISQTSNVTVPRGEWWYIHRCGAIVTYPVPTTNNCIQGRVCLSIPDQQISFYGPAVSWTTATAAASGMTLDPIQDVWAPPGTIIGALFSLLDIVSGGVQAWSISTELRYTPIRI